MEWHRRCLHLSASSDKDNQPCSEISTSSTTVWHLTAEKHPPSVTNRSSSILCVPGIFKRINAAIAATRAASARFPSKLRQTMSMHNFHAWAPASIDRSSNSRAPELPRTRANQSMSKKQDINYCVSRDHETRVPRLFGVLFHWSVHS